MARRGNPARLVIALSIAALLAVFLLYTSIAGGGVPSLEPGELDGRRGEVSLSGKVAGPVRRVASGARFRLRNIDGRGSIPVVYRDTLPDQFKLGRHISLDGRLRNGVFVGEAGTMVTKCPSKYTAA